MNKLPHLLTAKEVSNLICHGYLSESTITRYAQQGKLPFIQISKGKRRLFELETVQRFFAEKNFSLPSSQSFKPLF